ncbi:MAG: hypothetical protein IKY83_03495 [Proteobacteria bacterium]|nr:hypothetical protein [Pseudomonadota bacterium]
MKRITRVISVITGAISSFFAMGCGRVGGKIYGPPEMLEEYQKTGKIHHSGKEQAAPDAAKPENEAIPEMPKREDPPSAIYGPPEMFDLPEASAPEAFAAPEPSDASADAPEDGKTADAADKEAQDKDFEALKDANR